LAAGLSPVLLEEFIALSRPIAGFRTAWTTENGKGRERKEEGKRGGTGLSPKIYNPFHATI